MGFIDQGDATEVVLTHKRFTDEHMRNEHKGGWNGCMDGLARLFA